MFDNGARFPVPKRDGKLPLPSNVFGAQHLPDIPSSTTPPRVVDHEWMEKISPPPFVGRHVALDNSPALARFRDFHQNVVEEDQIQWDEEEVKVHKLMNQQVIDKIQDILNLAMEDHKKKADIEGVIKTTASQGWDPNYDPRVKFLASQVGVAGHLYAFAGRTERDCREHAAKLRKQAVSGSIPSFIVLRVGSTLNPGLIQRIYQIPVRETIRYSLQDFEPWLDRLASIGGPQRSVIAAESKKASLPLHEVFRRLKHDIAVRSMRVASKQVVESKHNRPDPFIPQKSRMVTQSVASKKKYSFLHNFVLAALGKRDFETLNKLASISHPLARKYGGPRAYRQALIDILTEVPGVRLYAEDFGGYSDRPVVSTIAKKLHLTREEVSPLRRALESSVVYVPRGTKIEDCQGCDYEQMQPEIQTRLSGLGHQADWHAPEFEDITATKTSSPSLGLEYFRRGFGRQTGLPSSLAKEKEGAGPTKRNVNPLMKDRGFLKNMGINISDDNIPNLMKDIDLGNFDFAEPGATFFGSNEV